MTTKEALGILERLKDAYKDNRSGEDIVTALDFAIDSLVIVGDIIDGGFEERECNIENFS